MLLLHMLRGTQRDWISITASAGNRFKCTSWQCVTTWKEQHQEAPTGKTMCCWSTLPAEPEHSGNPSVIPNYLQAQNTFPNWTRPTSESQVDPAALEMLHVKGNNRWVSASSSPISHFCNLKWLIWLAQANKTSFLKTEAGLLSISEGPSSWVDSKSPVVAAAKASTLPKMVGHHGCCPESYLFICTLPCPYNNPPNSSFTWITMIPSASPRPLQPSQDTSIFLTFWLYCWPLLGEFTSSFLIKAHSPY